MGTGSSQSQRMTLCMLDAPCVRAGETASYDLLFPMFRVAEVSFRVTFSCLLCLHHPFALQGYK